MSLLTRSLSLGALAATLSIAACGASKPTPPATPEHAEHHRGARGEGPAHHMGGMLGLVHASLTDLNLRPDQKAAVEAIRNDARAKSEPVRKAGHALSQVIAAGIEAGKVDRAATGSAIEALAGAVEADRPAVEDAMNRLHAVLDAAQRKQLIGTLHAHAGRMHEEAGKGDGPHDGHHGPGGPGGVHHGPGGEHRGPGGEHHGPGGPGGEHHGPGGPGGEFGPMGHLLDEVRATPEQRHAIGARLREEAKGAMPAMHEKMMAMREHMQAVGKAFESDAFDAKAVGVAANAPAMVRAMSERMVAFADVVASVLTPEQRTKLAAEMREHGKH